MTSPEPAPTDDGGAIDGRTNAGDVERANETSAWQTGGPSPGPGSRAAR